MLSVIQLDPKTQTNSLFYITHEITITKETCITVPISHKVIALSDDKALFRIDPCEQLNIVKIYGKEFLCKNLRFLYVYSNEVSQLNWGFGNIKINHNGSIFNVGANGKYAFEVIDYLTFIKLFNSINSINLDQMREKTLPYVKAVGVQTLSKFLTDGSASILDVNSKLDNFKLKYLYALQHDISLLSIGIKVVSLTVDSVKVN